MTQREALEILKTGRNVFLTGEPGSGKSYTVNQYVSYLRSCGIEPAITASTGIAATHIGGMTIHSWSGIGIKKYLSEGELSDMSGQERLKKRMESTSVLIIDEISMLDGQTLGLVDDVCRAVRGVGEPFGGLQVILVGDFFQLPPVARYDDPAPEFAFYSNAWQQAGLVMCYLSESHRQEDAVFLGVLRALRLGTMTDAHRETLLSRRVTVTGLELDSTVTKLFSHNANVDDLNTRELKKLSGGSFLFPMTQHGARVLVEQLKRGCLSPEQLVLKKDARVMFTKNSFDGKYVNGSTGVVVDFAKESGYPIVRLKGGKPIEVDPVQWSIKADGRAIASITQLPLRLAWAMTVHKSQGMSLDTAYMDLAGAFAFGQGYVALSRVRTLEGLHLGGLNTRALEVDRAVLEKDSEFRSASEQAARDLEATDSSDLQNQHAEFLKRIGGKAGSGAQAKTRPSAKTKEKPYEKTFELVSRGVSLHGMAKERGRTIGTIIDHLKELVTIGKISLDAIEHLRANEAQAIAAIHSAFQKLGASKMKPVHAHFNGRYSYDQIRLAQVFYRRS